VEPEPGRPLRVAVVAGHPCRRATMIERLRAGGVVDVRAWAEQAEHLLLLGTRLDVVLCAEDPPCDAAARLGERGCAIVVLPSDGDPHAALARVTRGPEPAALPRPQLAARQREVLVAYAAGNDLLPTLARRLGMEPETLKTHLRRIRAKYAEVGRPAPTRRDLYIRAVEDELLRPPGG
jgi:DNA-binding CsgD family transcriptional regulator